MTMLQHGMVDTAGGVDTGDIGHSLRFRSSSSAYLSTSFGSAGNRKTWTWSAWVKRGTLASVQGLFLAINPDSNNQFRLLLGNSDSVEVYNNSGGTTNLAVNSTGNVLFRDPSSTYHIVLSVDTTQTTATDRVKLYINNVASTLTFSTTPTLNLDTQVNSTGTHMLGRGDAASIRYFDGYMSRVCFVDGQALTPSSFGIFDTSINEWVTKSQALVKAVVDSGGSNSFMLDFDDGTSTTTLGYDKSSKGNNWTCTNISLTVGVDYDWFEDVPGNSYATFNPISVKHTTPAESNGNLREAISGLYTGSRGTTIEMSSGKWYAEYTINGSGGGSTPFYLVAFFGVVDSLGATYSPHTNGVGYGSYNGIILVNGTTTQTVSLWRTNGGTYVLGAAIDIDAGTVDFYLDGVHQATETLPTISGNWMFSWSWASGSGSGNANANFGQRPFAYTPPTGYLSLNQSNLIASDTVTVSGSFVGNANANGPFVWMNGTPKTLTINGNAVTFGTHADKLANGFKLRTSSASYNASGTNTWTATIDSDTQNIFKYNNAEVNP